MASSSVPPENERKLATAELKEFVKNTANKWDVKGKKKSRKETWALLERVYRKVRVWRKSGEITHVVNKLRGRPGVVISKKSSDYLTVLRCIYRDGDQKKRMSSWANALEYADHEQIRPKDLELFLFRSGGIDGARRKMAAIRGEAKVKKKAEAAKTAKIKKKAKLSQKGEATKATNVAKKDTIRKKAKAKKGKRPSASAPL
jgi:hypothetical protein